MAEERTDPPLWARAQDESPVAYAAFLAYRDLGDARSFVGAGRAVGKADSLIRRWALLHRWKERAWAWDIAQRKADEVALRGQRDEIVQRQLKDADRLQRLAMAKFSELVRRDPVSGELSLDPKVSHQDAVRIYRLGLEIERGLVPPTGEGTEAETGSPETDLRRLPSAELGELVQLAKERIQHAEEQHDGHPE